MTRNMTCNCVIGKSRCFKINVFGGVKQNNGQQEQRKCNPRIRRHWKYQLKSDGRGGAGVIKIASFDKLFAWWDGKSKGTKDSIDKATKILDEKNMM